MTVKLWHDDDTIPDVRPVLAAVWASLRDRLPGRATPAARAHATVGDDTHRGAPQLDATVTHPHRHDTETVLHNTHGTWVPVECSNGCGRHLLASGAWEQLEWTCLACVNAGTPSPALRLIDGGKRG